MLTNAQETSATQYRVNTESVENNYAYKGDSFDYSYEIDMDIY
jgi:hypothetical protein